MKDRETQLAFIKARAEGKSYSTITKELGIAKATCTSWEQSLRGEIEELRQAQLEELYTAYSMKREARIKALGTILQGIDTAIAGKPLEELPAGKLLELRLKYGRAILSRDMKENLEATAKELGTKVFTTPIRECTAIKEAQATQSDIYSYAPRSNAAADYTALIQDILEER